MQFSYTERLELSSGWGRFFDYGSISVHRIIKFPHNINRPALSRGRWPRSIDYILCEGLESTRNRYISACIAYSRINPFGGTRTNIMWHDRMTQQVCINSVYSVIVELFCGYQMVSFAKLYQVAD